MMPLYCEEITPLFIVFNFDWHFNLVQNSLNEKKGLTVK